MLEFAVVNCEEPMFDAVSVIGGRMLHLHERLLRFPFGLFFKVGICVAGPLVLFLGIGLHEF